MIRLLDRYIAKQVTLAIAIVLLVIMGLDTVFSFLAELEEMKADYQSAAVVEFVLYSFPRHFYEYMPYAILIGCLLGLGVMADHRELTIMRSAGVSIGRIGAAAAAPVLILSALNLCVGEYVAPALQQKVETRKEILRSREEVVSSQQGHWHRDGNHYIHFNAADPAGVLYGVTTYEFDDQRRLQKVSFAKQAEYDSNSQSWMLTDVSVTLITPQKIIPQHEQSQVWQVDLSPTVLQTLVLKPKNQSTSDLYHFSRYLSEQGLSAQQYRLAFWKQILQPLSIISLVILSLSFVFGSLRSSTMGFRVFCGILVALLFQYSQDILGSASLVYGVSPIAATMIPIFVCAAVGVVLIRRVG